MNRVTKKIGKTNPKATEIEADNMKAELSKVLQRYGYDENAGEFYTELFMVREEKRKYDEKQTKGMSDEINNKCEFECEDMYMSNSYSEPTHGKSR